MRLESYLLTEGRTKSISRDVALDLVRKNCKQMIKTKFKTEFYRGIDGAIDFGVIDPSKFTRKSRNTTNYYTLMIDNLPSWKAYPKRSKSIICSTDREMASRYSSGQNALRVIPYDGTTIGVCSGVDIWWSFDTTSGPLFLLNNKIDGILKQLEGFNASNELKWKNLVSLMSDADKLKDTIRTNIGEWEKSNKPLLSVLESMINPKKNGFKIAKIGDSLPRDREVWTDSICVLISSGEYGDFMEAL